MQRRILSIAVGALIAAIVPATALADGATASAAGGVTAPTAKVAVGSGGGATYGSQLITDREAAAKRRQAARRKAARRRALQRRAALKRRQLAAQRRLAARRRAQARARRMARKRAVKPPAGAPAPVGRYVFPIKGAYSYGGKDGQFGAKRTGHRHQGQDLSAAEGTPIVAPHAGTVKGIRFQAGGAGHYVVLGGADDRDYIFMHMRKGSIVVAEGEAVAAGQMLGEVGNTGRSFGAHLHFEIWVDGGWYTGGEPIDPLPLLHSWPGGS